MSDVFLRYCARYRQHLLMLWRLGSRCLPTGRRQQLIQQALVVCHLEEACSTRKQVLKMLQELAGRTGMVGGAAQYLLETLAPLPARQLRAGRRKAHGLVGWPLKSTALKESPDWPDRVYRAAATLAFDSRLQPAFVGLRAAGRPVHRVLFKVDDTEIDLEMTPDSIQDRVRLIGQITPAAEDSSSGWLRLSKAYEQWLLPLDDSGEFRVDGLAPGAYRLEFTFKDRMIEVPALPL